MPAYVAIDLKSFYASVECVERGLDPLTAKLVVADVSRTDKTICLAVSPALKALGIPGRPRLFEVNQILDQLVRSTPQARQNIEYIAAKPRMQLYLDYSNRINQIYQRYVSADDIHIYSVDECFIDVTPYLRLYHCTARELAMKMIRDVLRETGITATAGIGTNLYLCKVAMDIVAKHQPADQDGVRIASLTEQTYREQLWTHLPLTDFWRFGRGIVARLNSYGIRTMGDLARFSRQNSTLLYHLFGVQAELLIDHAWGYEPCTIADIKAYRSSAHSLTAGQVLSEPYSKEKARVIVQEMVDSMVLSLVEKKLVGSGITLHISYEDKTRKPAHGSCRLPEPTHSHRQLSESFLELFEKQVDPCQPVRRVNISVDHVLPEDSPKVQGTQEAVQMDLFQEVEKQRKQQEERKMRAQEEQQIQEAVLSIKRKFGKNAILKGLNFAEGSTARERNHQIGGHKA